MIKIKRMVITFQKKKKNKNSYLFEPQNETEGGKNHTKERPHNLTRSCQKINEY